MLGRVLLCCRQPALKVLQLALKVLLLALKVLYERLKVWLHEVLGGPISNWAKRLVKKMR